MKWVPFIVCVVVIAGCDEHRSIPPNNAGNPGTSTISSAEVVRARIVPFTRDDGLRTQMVLVDWKNTGETSIRAVDADIHVFDRKGNRMESGALATPIYAVSDSDPGIAPGETYIEPVGKGYILAPFFGEAARVEVVITEVVADGAFGDMLTERPASVQSRQSTTSNQTSNVFQLHTGDSEVLIAASESALDRLIKSVSARDEYGVAELMATKQISKVPSGTKCLIIDPGFTVHEIRILEGLHAGEAAFVPAEFVTAAVSAAQEASSEQVVRAEAEQAAQAKAEHEAALQEEAKFRTWTSSSGKHTTEAKIVSYSNGVVTLARRDGKKIKVDMTKLGDVDREFVSKWRKVAQRENVVTVLWRSGAFNSSQAQLRLRHSN